MPGRALLVVALLVGAFATGFASVSFAQSSTTRTDDRAARNDRPARPPSQLWGRFPLGKSTVERTSTRTLRSPSPPAAAIANDDSNSGERLMLVVGLLALGMLVPALGALVLLKTRQRRLVAQSREGLLAIIAEARPPEQRLVEIQTFTATLGCDKVSLERPRARGEQVKEESQAKSPQQEGPVASRDYTQLGDRVAAVLQAAEEAAEQMRGEAQTAAEQMTREAKQESSSLLESAKSEAQRVRVEADREAKNTREAVESYATNHRRDAEEKAAKMLSEAEAQARASREAAEERAATLGEEVREQERMIRGRMQRYLAALRDVSGQIEEVIGETERGEPTLVEALEPERPRAQQESG
jgi:hypothetical protein